MGAAACKNVLLGDVGPGAGCKNVLLGDLEPAREVTQEDVFAE